MPKGPNGQKRPADAIGCAVLVGRIATGEFTEAEPTKRESRGVVGAEARARSLSAEQRSGIARKAASARWSNHDDNRKGAI